jgi:hypothetical protein
MFAYLVKSQDYLSFFTFRCTIVHFGAMGAVISLFESIVGG